MFNPFAEGYAAEQHVAGVATHIGRAGAGGSSNVADTEDERSDTWHRVDTAHSKPHDRLLGDVQVLCTIIVCGAKVTTDGGNEALALGPKRALGALQTERILPLCGPDKLQLCGGT